MKIAEDIENKEMRSVTIDPSLDKLKDQNLFPEKLAKANEMLKTARLPGNKQSDNKLSNKKG